MLQFM